MKVPITDEAGSFWNNKLIASLDLQKDFTYARVIKSHFLRTKMSS